MKGLPHIDAKRPAEYGLNFQREKKGYLKYHVSNEKKQPRNVCPPSAVLCQGSGRSRYQATFVKTRAPHTSTVGYICPQIPAGGSLNLHFPSIQHSAIAQQGEEPSYPGDCSLSCVLQISPGYTMRPCLKRQVRKQINFSNLTVTHVLSSAEFLRVHPKDYHTVISTQVEVTVSAS